MCRPTAVARYTGVRHRLGGSVVAAEVRSRFRICRAREIKAGLPESSNSAINRSTTDLNEASSATNCDKLSALQAFTNFCGCFT